MSVLRKSGADRAAGPRRACENTRDKASRTSAHASPTEALNDSSVPPPFRADTRTAAPGPETPRSRGQRHGLQRNPSPPLLAPEAGCQPPPASAGTRFPPRELAARLHLRYSSLRGSTGVRRPGPRRRGGSQQPAGARQRAGPRGTHRGRRGGAAPPGTASTGGRGHGSPAAGRPGPASWRRPRAEPGRSPPHGSGRRASGDSHRRGPARLRRR